MNSIIESLDVFLIDITDPTISINNPINNSVFRIGEVISITGIAEDNVAVTEIESILDAEAPIDITSSFSNNAWSYDLVTDDLADGAHILIFRAYDDANNLKSDSIQITLLEIEPPEVTITEPANNTVFKLGRAIYFEGRAKDNKEVTFLEMVINGNSSINISSSLKSGTYWDYYLDSREHGLLEGVNSIEILALDAVNNIGSAKLNVILDNSPPESDITTPGKNEIFKNGDVIEFKGTSSDNVGISLLEFIVDGAKVYDITNNLKDGDWSFGLIDTDNLKSGVHNITLRATDKMWFTAECSVEIIIDAKPPEIEITEISKALLIGETLTLAGTASDDVGIIMLELIFAGNDPINCTAGFSEPNNTWSYTWDSSAYSKDLDEGVYKLSIRATDVVGRQTTQSIEFKVITLFTDSDYDGMPDWWEQQYDRFDPNKDDADKDYDRDGFTNLEEYLGDDGKPDNDDFSDPNDDRSNPHITQEPSSKASDDYTIFYIILVIIIVIILLFLFMFINKRKRDEAEAGAKSTLGLGAIFKRAKSEKDEPSVKTIEPQPYPPLMFPPGFVPPPGQPPQPQAPMFMQMPRPMQMPMPMTMPTPKPGSQHAQGAPGTMHKPPQVTTQAQGQAKVQPRIQMPLPMVPNQKPLLPPSPPKDKST
jgi:DNA/RNA endonuclease YhcR with UshA esterase domain